MSHVRTSAFSWFPHHYTAPACKVLGCLLGSGEAPLPRPENFHAQQCRGNSREKGIKCLYIIYLLFFVYECFADMHLWSPKRPEEGAGSPGTKVRDNCELPYRLGAKPRSPGRVAGALAC